MVTGTVNRKTRIRKPFYRNKVMEQKARLVAPMQNRIVLQHGSGESGTEGKTCHNFTMVYRVPDDMYIS